MVDARWWDARRWDGNARLAALLARRERLWELAGMAFAIVPADAVALPTARGGLLSGRPWVSGKPPTRRGASGVCARPLRHAAVRCSALPVSAESDYKLKEV